ncbi:hypothetical protein B0H14DRAFT_2637208 [Mycena olivaceomarginata]|nr:hypothetical protein B0H14DRAFT_2637208 [Mycena olivaceomarginata]
MADASGLLNVPNQNDELSQKIIGSNELSLNAIKVARFRENKRNKRSNEVTRMATTPVEIAWPPGHCDPVGNERADELAKERTGLGASSGGTHAYAMRKSRDKT